MTAPRPVRPRVVPPAPVRQVNVLDLTVDQIATVELGIGIPVSRWNRAPSEARLYAAVLAVIEGVDPSEFGGLSLRQLKERVDLTADTDPDQ